MGILDALKNIAGVKQQVETFDPSIQLNQSQLLRQSPTSAVNIQLKEQQRFAQLEQAKLESSQYEKQITDYLKTPEGIKQYAMESGQTTDSTKMETVGAGKGSNYTVQEYPVIERTYTSPYGTITEPISSGRSESQREDFMNVNEQRRTQFETDLAKQNIEPVYTQSGELSGFLDKTTGRSIGVQSYIDKLNQPKSNQMEYPSPSPSSESILNLKPNQFQTQIIGRTSESYVPPTYISPATTFEKVQIGVEKNLGVRIPSLSEAYKATFRSYQSPYEQQEAITPRRVVGDIGEAGLKVPGIAFEAGQYLGESVGELREKVPYKFYQPESTFIVPQKITYTPEFKGQEFKIPKSEVYSTQYFKDVFGTLGGVAGAGLVFGGMEAINPYLPLGLGLAALQTPRQISTSERIGYGVVTGLSALPLITPRTKVGVYETKYTMKETTPQFTDVGPKTIQPVMGEKSFTRKVFDTSADFRGYPREQTVLGKDLPLSNIEVGRGVRVTKTKEIKFLNDLGIKPFKEKLVFAETPTGTFGSKAEAIKLGVKPKDLKYELNIPQTTISGEKLLITNGVNSEVFLKARGVTRAAEIPGLRITGPKGTTITNYGAEAIPQDIFGVKGIKVKQTVESLNIPSFKSPKNWAGKMQAQDLINLPEVNTRDFIQLALGKSRKLPPIEMRAKSYRGKETPINLFQPAKTNRLRYTKFDNKPYADKVINTADEFVNIRKETFKAIKQKDIDSPLKDFLFGSKIEPQVSEPIRLLKQKGYITYDSGFAKAGSGLAKKAGSKVGINYIGIDNINVREARRLLTNAGISDVKVKNLYNRNRLYVDQAGKSLRDTEKLFKSAIEILPGKGITREVSPKIFNGQLRININKLAKYPEAIPKSFTKVSTVSQETLFKRGAGEMKYGENLFTRANVRTYKVTPVKLPEYKVPSMFEISRVKPSKPFKLEVSEPIISSEVKAIRKNLFESSLEEPTTLTANSKRLLKSTVPTVTIPRPTVTTTAIPKVSTSLIPKNAAVNIFETTRTGTMFKTRQIEREKIKPILIPVTETQTKLNNRLIERLNPLQLPKTESKTIQEVKLNERLNERLNQRLVEKLLTVEKQAPSLKPGLYQIQVPRGDLNIPKTTFKVNPQSQPTKTLPKSPLPKVKSNLFTVEFRRRGKFFPIAKTTNPNIGINIGKSAARQTLGASFRIKKSEGGFLGLNPTEEFRLGKGMGILVQRAPTRLTSFGERREIKQSRRIGGIKLL